MSNLRLFIKDILTPRKSQADFDNFLEKWNHSTYLYKDIKNNIGIFDVFNIEVVQNVNGLIELSPPNEGILISVYEDNAVDIDEL